MMTIFNYVVCTIEVYKKTLVNFQLIVYKVLCWFVSRDLTNKTKRSMHFKQQQILKELVMAKENGKASIVTINKKKNKLLITKENGELVIIIV